MGIRNCPEAVQNNSLETFSVQSNIPETTEDPNPPDLSNLQQQYKENMEELRQQQNLYLYNINNNVAQPSTQSAIQSKIEQLSQLKEQINEKIKSQNDLIKGYFNTIDRKNNVIDQQNKNLNLINSDISDLYQELESNKENLLELLL